MIIFGIPDNLENSENEKLLEDKKSIDKILESINIKSNAGEIKFKRIKTKNQNPNYYQIRKHYSKILSSEGI